MFRIWGKYMDAKEFLDRLKKGKRLYGTAVFSPSPLWPSAVKRAGVDFVFIDTEHTPFDRTVLAQMCLAYKGCGLPALVRIASPDPHEARIKFLMEEPQEFWLLISNLRNRSESWLVLQSCVR